MRQTVLGIFVAAMLSAVALGQDQPSLGDVARANRQQQQAQEAAGTVPKVITNKDLPASARAGIPEENPADPMTTVSGVQRSYPSNRERPFNPPNFDAQRGGENLRGQIEAQENRINELQARIDRANATMHPNGSTVQYEGPVNGRQAMQAQRIEMMQQMLEQQKERLAAMQDTARREGMHTAVVDP
jgi:hypothetical protein